MNTKQTKIPRAYELLAYLFSCGFNILSKLTNVALVAQNIKKNFFKIPKREMHHIEYLFKMSNISINSQILLKNISVRDFCVSENNTKY